MPQRQGFTGGEGEGHRIAEELSGVLSAMAATLHETAKRPPRLRSNHLDERRLGAWTGAGLETTAYARRYGYRSPLVLVVTFRSAKLPVNSLTVRIDLVGTAKSRRRPAGEWVKARRRSKRAPTAAQQWWIDPNETPLGVTKSVLALYLWRAGLIDDGHVAAQAVVGGALERANIDSADAYLILEKLRAHFFFPDDWRGYRSYLRRVIRGVTGEPGRLAAAAAALDVNRSTLYRWISSAGVSPSQWPALPPPALEEIAGRVDRRQVRKEALRLLTSGGKQREAARKFLQRRSAEGVTLKTIVRELRRGRRV